MKKNNKVLIFINIVVECIIYLATVVFGLFLVAFNSLPTKELYEVYKSVLASSSSFDSVTQIKEELLSQIDFQKISNFFYRIKNILVVFADRISDSIFKVSLYINIEEILVNVKKYLSNNDYDDTDNLNISLDYRYNNEFSVSRKFLINCVLTC